MRVFNKDLKKALKLLREKKYTHCIAYLEPKIPIFLEDQQYYYLLGYAFFRINDLGAAKFYLERGILLDTSNLDLKLLLAVVHLRKKDTTAAAKVWLAILEADPDNDKAKAGLEKLRKIEGKAQMDLFLEKGRYGFLLPFLGFPGKKIVGLTSIALFCIAALFIVRNYVPLLKERQNQVNREELLYVDMELRDFSVTDPQSSFTYLLTRDEVEQTYDRVIEYYDNYRDNLAQREVNRLLHSNASQEIKSKVLLLEGYFKMPDYLDFYTDYSYTQAATDPLLYDKCFVLWTGRVGNLEVLDDRIEFKFIVGFEDEIDFEGVIPAYVNYEVRIDPEMAVEILGRLEFDSSGLVLKVESIRHIIAE